MADTLFFHYYELTMMSASCSNMPHLAAHRLPERLSQPSFVQKASARFLAHTSLTQACHSSFKGVTLASHQILHSLGFFFLFLNKLLLTVSLKMCHFQVTILGLTFTKQHPEENCPSEDVQNRCF